MFIRHSMQFPLGVSRIGADFIGDRLQDAATPRLIEWLFLHQPHTPRNGLVEGARAGIDNFRWHDLRHTWASWLMQNGTPLYDLQEMAAWKSSEMMRRYAHLAPAQMEKHAAVIGDLLKKQPAKQDADERHKSVTMLG